MFSVGVVADYSERFCYDPATDRGFISFVKCRGIEKEITKEECGRLRDCNFAKECALPNTNVKQSAKKEKAKKEKAAAIKALEKSRLLEEGTTNALKTSSTKPRSSLC